MAKIRGGQYRFLDFDPALIEPIQWFELSAGNTQCRIISREEQIREAQKGHQSLRDKYSGGKR